MIVGGATPSEVHCTASPKGGTCRLDTGVPGGRYLAGVRTLSSALHAALLLGGLTCGGGEARAATAEPDQGGEGSSVYHTPLAGEAGRVLFMGRNVAIPAQNRGYMTSLTLGASLLTPKQGERSVLPVAALYVRRVGEEARTRNMISVFVNELEYDQSLGGGVELVGHFENHTLPVQQSELVDGAEVEETSLLWGTLLGSVGPGWRLPVHPFQVDNDIRLQLLARVGYFYAKRGDDAAPGIWVPPETMLYGAKLRARYDGMRRNLLELPHRGIAAGWDLDYLYRDRWREQAGTSTVPGNRDYLQVSGYLVGAGGAGGSERDRVLFCLYGGHTGQSRGDRFNAFRINGATFPSEADDLARPHYSGTIYNSALARAYATASAGYRRELNFFMYLSVLGSYVWADRSAVQGRELVVFRDKKGAAATVALDSAFFWNSSLYLAYAWETGMVRNGRSGSGVTLLWNKLL